MRQIIDEKLAWEYFSERKLICDFWDEGSFELPKNESFTFT